MIVIAVDYGAPGAWCQERGWKSGTSSVLKRMMRLALLEMAVSKPASAETNVVVRPRAERCQYIGRFCRPKSLCTHRALPGVG